MAPRTLELTFRVTLDDCPSEADAAERLRGAFESAVFAEDDDSVALAGALDDALDGLSVEFGEVG